MTTLCAIIAVAIPAPLIPDKEFEARAAKILRSKTDGNGKLLVSHKQIEFIRDTVNTGDLKKIAVVISPSGIKKKFTWYAYAFVQPEVGPSVMVDDSPKSQWLNWADSRIPNPEHLLAMSGLYEFCRFSIPSLGFRWIKLNDRKWAQSREDMRKEVRLPDKYFPIWYLKLSNEKGRLWIREYGYACGEAE